MRDLKLGYPPWKKRQRAVNEQRWKPESYREATNYVSETYFEWQWRVVRVIRWASSRRYSLNKVWDVSRLIKVGSQLQYNTDLSMLPPTRNQRDRRLTFRLKQRPLWFNRESAAPVPGGWVDVWLSNQMTFKTNHPVCVDLSCQISRSWNDAWSTWRFHAVKLLAIVNALPTEVMRLSNPRIYNGIILWHHVSPFILTVVYVWWTADSQRHKEQARKHQRKGSYVYSSQ